MANAVTQGEKRADMIPELVLSSKPDRGRKYFADPDPAGGSSHRFEQEAGSGEVKRCCEAQVPHSKVISAVPAMLR
jgi:hypothetical protein